MTMAQMEESIQEDLTQLGDPLSQMEYLMACARAHEGIPPEERRDENLVADCQAKTWVETRWEQGRLRLLADSESFLVRGVLALLCELYQHRRPKRWQRTPAPCWIAPGCGDASQMGSTGGSAACWPGYTGRGRNGRERILSHPGHPDQRAAPGLL